MNLFDAFRFDVLMNPWALLLLLALPPLFVFEVAARAPGVITLSTGEAFAALPGDRASRLRWLPALLRAAGLALLILALARPMQGYQLRKDRADVIDIMLCVDVSGSMAAMDFEWQGERRDRLHVTKEAVRHFLESRKNNRRDRYGLDRIGLILYAGYAWTQCPLTLDYAVLERELDLAQIDNRDKRKAGTAIGSAIGLAASRLRDSEAESKVVILLTDGMNNAGELDPMTAARLAKDFGIRVYTIGAGSGDVALVPRQDLFGQRLVKMNMPIDMESLEKIASLTGAKCYRAEDTESLSGAYEEIDALETTEIEINDYYEHEDAFEPYAVLGTLALLASLLGRRWRFDPIP